jgi:predicted transcriptional regulator
LQILYNTVSRRLRPQGEETRYRIVCLMQSHAGIRYSQLSRKTGLAHGTLSHHIKILERQKRIVVRRDSGSTRLFPESYDNELGDALSSVSHPTTMAILTLLLRHKCNYSQVKKTIMKSGSTVCKHLKRLLSVGLVSRRKIGRIWVYGITDPDKAIMIMIMNRRYRECQGTN